MDAQADQATVYVIIPTFNRWNFTRTCLDLLAAQTFPSVVAIVSDGGSTDGTREAIKRDYPQVHVVFDGKDRWWAGSSALGVEHAYRLGRNGDFILLLNNDTEIPPDYVTTMVAASLRENAAVGAKVIDSRDHTVVLDAGEYIVWETYEFPVMTAIEPGQIFCNSVDVLPGRSGFAHPFRDDEVDRQHRRRHVSTLPLRLRSLLPDQGKG